METLEMARPPRFEISELSFGMNPQSSSCPFARQLLLAWNLHSMPVSWWEIHAIHWLRTYCVPSLWSPWQMKEMEKPISHMRKRKWLIQTRYKLTPKTQHSPWCPIWVAWHTGAAASQKDSVCMPRGAPCPAGTAELSSNSSGHLQSFSCHFDKWATVWSSDGETHPPPDADECGEVSEMMLSEGTLMGRAWLPSWSKGWLTDEVTCHCLTLTLSNDRVD